MVYFAINLDDFHKNQKGESKTNAEIMFINAISIDKAKEILKQDYPQTAWSVIPKRYFDKNII